MVLEKRLKSGIKDMILTNELHKKSSFLLIGSVNVNC